MRKVFLLFGLTVSYCFSGDTFVNFYGKNMIEDIIKKIFWDPDKKKIKYL